MLRRFSILTCFLFGLLQLVSAQDGKLAGKVLNNQGGPVGFTTVVVYEGDLVRYGTQTAEDGTFSIQPVQPGTYRVEARFLGNAKSLENVVVSAAKTRNVTINFQQDYTIEDVEIVAPTIFDKEPIVGRQMNNEDIVNAGIRSINGIAALTAGVYQGDAGEAISIRGARPQGTTTYIDGVKVRGQSTLPQGSIGQVQVITGGTPAEYGDFTGGVVNITTSNPSAKFSGGVELLTSEYLDDFGRNLAGLTLSGPLITRKRKIMIGGEEKEYKSSLLGFFLNGEISLARDQDPAAIGIFKLKDGILEDLEQTPVQISDDGLSFRSRANFIRRDDMDEITAKINNTSKRGRALFRLDFQPTDNILVKLGGNVELIDSDSWGLGSMLYAPDNGSAFKGGYYRGFFRFQQSFSGDNNSSIKNLFYSIQADYSLYQRRFINRRHEDRYFDYGYVGKFDFELDPVYLYVNNPADEVSSAPYWRTIGFVPSNLTFDPTGSHNPILANYNTAILDHVAQNGVPNLGFGLSQDATVFSLASLTELGFRQGITNGGGPGGIYSMFSGIGSAAGGYTKFDFEQYRLSGQATAEIKGHNIKTGFEFEQRVERSFGLGASSLWGLMRGYTNFHIANLSDDPSAWTYNLNEGGEWNDTISVPRNFVANDQRFFDQRLREKLGLDPNGTDFVNIDALPPETFSLDMFTADELLFDGLGPLAYYGYDFKGNKQDPVAPEQFFTDPMNRPLNAFSPTYISAFIQDKFEFEDIIFNVGLRVDRFDANQKVLKDNFSLYPTFSAGELPSLLSGYALPAGIGNDFIPYVDDPSAIGEVLGFRDDETWYDANGAPISSAELARRSGGRVLPATTQDSVSIESFEDYRPQTTFMPRISFSFPISDVALFFAHYDVLAQRPGQLLATQSSLLAGRISDYAFLENRPTTTIVNPNLKPEITIDYEAGFKQRIGTKVALTLSAFYREQRNMIRFRRFSNAYPFSYDTYDNLDFGTVKGFSFTLDRRRSNNLMLSGSYTLQFADATGSNLNSARAVVNFLEGVGVLRTTLPISNDQRHRITGNIDYRFTQTPGPGVQMGDRTIYPLKNFGANAIVYLGSGTPFTKNSVAIPSVTSGVNLVNQIEGTPNGARKPWTYRIDLRFDKRFAFGGGKKSDGTDKRAYDVNIYLQLLNALNTLNVRSVYRFTGLPDDDGYLSSDSGEQDILSQIDPISYQDHYNVRVRNPNNYNLPRRIRLGLLFNF
ncbi:MAG: TonB-dependent receptor [Bacteroidota bacterium]